MTTPTQSKIHPTATLGIMYQSHFSAALYGKLPNLHYVCDTF